jgi:hypothetical protein
MDNKSLHVVGRTEDTKEDPVLLQAHINLLEKQLVHEKARNLHNNKDPPKREGKEKGPPVQSTPFTPHKDGEEAVAAVAAVATLPGAPALRLSLHSKMRMSSFMV